MKRIRLQSLRKILISALAIISLATSNLGAAGNTSYSDPTIETFVDPLYPIMLSAMGVYEGSATVMIGIDDSGAVIDWLPLSTTADAFIRSISQVINSWTFKPGTLNGENVPSAITMTVNFKSEGILMSINGIAMTRAFLTGNYETRETPCVAGMSELDSIPTPITIVKPNLTSVPPELRNGKVELGFFIDSEGSVRMPFLMSNEGDIRLAYAAYDAIVMWKFEPPTVKGRPIAVRASQVFIFKPSSK